MTGDESRIRVFEIDGYKEVIAESAIFRPGKRLPHLQEQTLKKGERS